jgi:hypothetical protein
MMHLHKALNRGNAVSRLSVFCKAEKTGMHYHRGGSTQKDTENFRRALLRLANEAVAGEDQPGTGSSAGSVQVS